MSYSKAYDQCSAGDDATCAVDGFTTCCFYVEFMADELVCDSTCMSYRSTLSTVKWPTTIGASAYLCLEESKFNGFQSLINASIDAF